MAFPRLLHAVAELAPREEILAQIGPDDTRYGFRHAKFFPPLQFDAALRQARLVIAHAGMGTVLAARAAKVPLLLLPRRAALSEHRNDHQLATARALVDHPGIRVAWHEDQIAALASQDIGCDGPDPTSSLPSLIDAVHGFVEAAAPAPNAGVRPR